MYPHMSEFITNATIVVAIVMIMVLFITIVFPLHPEETERRGKWKREQKEALKEQEELIKQRKMATDKEGFVDHSKLGVVRKIDEIAMWKRCDKCGSIFRKKRLKRMKDIDEYFCSDCAGLAKIYIEGRLSTKE